MGYIKFSTPNADYTLSYGNHFKKTLTDGLEDADCTILETGKSPPDSTEFVKDYLDNTRFIQYKDIAKKHVRDSKPIFLTDVPTKGRSSDKYQTLLPHLATLSPMVLATYLSFTGHGSPLMFGAAVALTAYDGGTPTLFLPNKDFSKSKLRTVISYLTEMTHFYQRVVLRDAITARKAEEFLAPMMRKRLGRKPKIGMIFGAAHNGVKVSLQNPKIRNGILGFHSKLNYLGIDQNYLNKVFELDFTNAILEPEMVEWEADLFK